MSQHRYTMMSVVLFLGFLVYSSPRAHGAPLGEPQGGYGQYHGHWDTPPRDFSDIQRQGFRDGIEGARNDIQNHRQPDPNNRDEFRSPHVPYNMQESRRRGLRHGYEQARPELSGYAGRH